MELANDLVIFYDGYLEYIFNNDDKSPRIVQIKAKESTCSRISEIDEKTGKSEWHGYSAEWHKGTPEDLVATPLLDRQSPLLDLKIRIGLAPNNNGKTIVGKDRRFIHNLRISTPGRFITAIRIGGAFLRPAGMISPVQSLFQKSLIKNQMALRYIIYIQETFWEKLYASEKIVKDDEKAIRRGKFLQDMNDFLAGEENAGKGFISHFRYDRIKGFEDKDIIITPLESFFKGGEYIEDSEEVSNMMCYGMGVHPSIIGAAPGKGKVSMVPKPASYSLLNRH